MSRGRKLIAGVIMGARCFGSVAALSGGPGLGPSRLFVDFDGTITAADTTPRIAEAAIAKVAATRGSVAAAERQELWGRLTDEYLAAYYTFLPSSAPTPLPPGTSRAEILAEVESFTARLTEFEEASVARVESSGVLSGISRADLELDAETVPLRPGASEALRLALARGVPTTILSINWSKDLVSSVLRSAGIPIPQDTILTNDLLFEAEGSKPLSRSPLSWCRAPTSLDV